jgi:hypothetical protein
VNESQYCPVHDQPPDWCPHPVLDGYAGQWVALRGPEIVSCGLRPLTVIEDLRARGLKADMVFRMPAAGQQQEAR